MAGKLYFAVALLCVTPIVYACNEAICASVVSKCMLTQSCKCDLKDCSCCKDCFNCLSYLYSECCSCVDMCPKPNDTQTELSKTSYVEELADGVPGLFSALTSEADPEERWLSITYPVDIDLSAYRPASENKLVYHLQSVEQDPIPESRNVVTFNCTVAYMSQCTSSDKCRASCRSMGANSLRWFHDGCCECVGDKCLFYGINESSPRRITKLVTLLRPKDALPPLEDKDGKPQMLCNYTGSLTLQTETQQWLQLLLSGRNRCLACSTGRGGVGKVPTDNALDEDLSSYDDLDYGEEVDAQSV